MPKSDADRWSRAIIGIAVGFYAGNIGNRTVYTRRLMPINRSCMNLRGEFDFGGGSLANYLASCSLAVSHLPACPRRLKPAGFALCAVGSNCGATLGPISALGGEQSYLLQARKPIPRSDQWLVGR